jgi:hypothetical protein
MDIRSLPRACRKGDDRGVADTRWGGVGLLLAAAAQGAPPSSGHLYTSFPTTTFWTVTGG